MTKEALVIEPIQKACIVKLIQVAATELLLVCQNRHEAQMRGSLLVRNEDLE
jgi:hypothetical protein